MPSLREVVEPTEGDGDAGARLVCLVEILLAAEASPLEKAERWFSRNDMATGGSPAWPHLFDGWPDLACGVGLPGTPGEEGGLRMREQRAATEMETEMDGLTEKKRKVVGACVRVGGLDEAEVRPSCRNQQTARAKI